MRIRSIKPEFWRSDDITALDWDTRLVFIGLWSYVDDNGVGLDRLASIAGDLFAGDLETDAPETFARVSRGLQTLAERELVARYNVDRKRYIYITAWPDHQRIDKPNKPRFPLPDGQIAHPSRDPRETPATGSEEQRNSGTVDPDGLTRIREATNGSATHARKVVKDVLAKAKTPPRDPVAYVLRAVANEPELYVRKRHQPKKDQECPKHAGQWADNCGGCASDARAAS